MKWMFLFFVPVALGCSKIKAPDENTSVCEPEGAYCESCFDGVTTCSFRGIVVEHGSCAECQAREILYEEVCAAGLSLTRGEVDDEAVCESVDPTEYYSTPSGG